MVKSVFHKLGADDKKAKERFLDSLSVCAHDHILSRRLLERFSTAAGPMYAIIGDWFDLKQMITYDYTIFAPAGSPPYADGDRPTERLVAFVKKYLQEANDGIVVCENWCWERKSVKLQPWPPPRVACYGDNEVYHIVTPEITDQDMIEAGVAARHHWQTGICTSCNEVPGEDIPNEGWLDEIVQNTKHIFIPAFDGSGYLIWSPE